MAKYLEYNGLSYFWSKLKDFFAKKTEVLFLTGGTLTGPLNGTTATFSGNVSGNNATFSGDVSGNNATFSGDVNADGDIVALGEVQAADRLVVNADENNYGAIRFNSENAVYDGVRFYGGDDEYGDEMVIGAGGMFIAGSGESSYNLYNALINAGEIPGNEHSFITADGNLYLFSHCNTIENRTQLMLYDSSSIGVVGRCGADHGVTINTSSNNGVTATTNISHYYAQDKHSYWTGDFVNEVNGSAGKVRSFIAARNKKTDGSDVTNYLGVDVNKDGSATYFVSNTTNFRSAIWAACKPTQLYNNANGSNGTITLSVSAANYNHIRIYYRNTDDAAGSVSSVDVYSPNGKIVNLACVDGYATGNTWIQVRLVKINGTSIATYSNDYTQAHINSNGTAGSAHSNYVAILRVEGWND